MKLNPVLLHLAMLYPSVRAFTAKAFGTAATSARSNFIRSVSSVPAISSNASAQPKAFVISRADVRRQFISKTTTRWMSSIEGEGPSIVEQCRQKISVALETDDVKVIGECKRSLDVPRYTGNFLASKSNKLTCVLMERTIDSLVPFHVDASRFKYSSLAIFTNDESIQKY